MGALSEGPATSGWCSPRSQRGRSPKDSGRFVYPAHINMEAQRGPHVEDSSLLKGPVSTSMLIWRSMRFQVCAPTLDRLWEIACVELQVWTLVWYVVYHGHIRIPYQGSMLKAHGLDHRNCSCTTWLGGLAIPEGPRPEIRSIWPPAKPILLYGEMPSPHHIGTWILRMWGDGVQYRAFKGYSVDLICKIN